MMIDHRPRLRRFIEAKVIDGSRGGQGESIGRLALAVAPT